jgi:hypothetical protein
MSDISGLDKVALLRALWLNQKSAAFFAMSPMRPPAFDSAAAAEAVKTKIDYFQGRAIKMNLAGDTVDGTMYDRYAGPGTCARVVAELKDGRQVPTTSELLCPDGSGNTFRAFGEPMIDGKPDTVLCGNCPHWQRAHASMK